jgi:plasmid maintenance system killer protein
LLVTRNWRITFGWDDGDAVDVSDIPPMRAA